MKHIFFILIVFISVGCANRSNRLEQLFSVKKNLVGAAILSEADLLTPIEVYVTNKSDILLTENQKKHFAAIVDKKNANKLIRICPVGKGPNEYLPPLFFSRHKLNKSVSFFAPRLHKFYSYDLYSKDSIIFKLKNEYSGFKNANQLVQVNDTLFFSTMANSSIAKDRYGLYDVKGELIYSDLSYPENNSQDISDNLKSIAFQSNIAVNPENGHIVTACKFIEHIEIMSVEDSGINKIFELQTSDGKFENRSQGKFMSLRPSQDHPISYLCIDATKDFIYLLYSGRTIEKFGKQKAFMGNTILKFNWSGQAIEQLRLNHDIISFSVSDSSLYAIGLEASTPKLLKYNMQ